MRGFQHLVACLSPESANLSYKVCYATAVASIAVVSLAFIVEKRRKDFSWLPLYLPLWLLQPGWRLAWDEIHSGMLPVPADCGFSIRGESIFLFLTLATMLVAIMRSRTVKRVFLLRVVTVCWIVHALALLVRFLPYDYAIFSAVLPRPVAIEVVDTIEIGQAQTIAYTFALTIVCFALYVYERQNRRVTRG
jgi:hypothetical protein